MYELQFSFQEFVECTVSHVNVSFSNNFDWCMHGQNWNTDIDGVNVQCGYEFSNGAAAAPGLATLTVTGTI